MSSVERQVAHSYAAEALLSMGRSTDANEHLKAALACASPSVIVSRDIRTGLLSCTPSHFL